MFARSHSAAFIRGAAQLIAFFSVAGCFAHSTPSTRPEPSNSGNVGYGFRDRRDFTASTASLDVDAVHNAPTSLADLLEGRVAGLEIQRLGGRFFSARIRGPQSFAGYEPLYIIDGVPQSSGVEGTLADLNPADIMRIEVLKDASATAVYGSRANNGVIIITMKRAGK